MRSFLTHTQVLNWFGYKFTLLWRRKLFQENIQIIILRTCPQSIHIAIQESGFSQEGTRIFYQMRVTALVNTEQEADEKFERKSIQ